MNSEYLQLPISPAEGDDIWLACIACRYPTEGRGVVYEDHVGLPVEYVVKIRHGGTLEWRGLHAKCLDINKPKETANVKPAGLVSSENIHRIYTEKLVWSETNQAYIDNDGCLIRDKFGQKL